MPARPAMWWAVLACMCAPAITHGAYPLVDYHATPGWMGKTLSAHDGLVVGADADVLVLYANFVRDAKRLRRIGSLDFDAPGRDTQAVVIGRKHAYVAFGAAGVGIYRVSTDMEDVRKVAAITQLGNVQDLAISRDASRLWIADMTIGLVAYLVATPPQPEILWEVFIPEAVAVADSLNDLVYVASNVQGLVLVNRTSQAVVTSVALTAPLRTLQIHANLTAPPRIVAVSEYGAVVVVATTVGVVPVFCDDPQRPTVLTPLPLDAVSSVQSSAYSAYMAGGADVSFVEVDFTNPERLVTMGKSAPGTYHAMPLGNASAIAVERGLAYVAVGESLAVYDLSVAAEESGLDVGQIVGVTVGAVVALVLGVWIYRLLATRKDDFRCEVIIENAKQAARSSLRVPSNGTIPVPASTGEPQRQGEGDPLLV